MSEDEISFDSSKLLSRDFYIKRDEKEFEISKFRRTAVRFPEKIVLSENLLKSLFLIFGDGHYKSAKVTLRIRNKEFVEIRKIGGRYVTNLSIEGENLLEVIRTLENWLTFIGIMLKEDDLQLKWSKEVIKECKLRTLN